MQEFIKRVWTIIMKHEHAIKKNLIFKKNFLTFLRENQECVPKLTKKSCHLWLSFHWGFKPDQNVRINQLQSSIPLSFDCNRGILEISHTLPSVHSFSVWELRDYIHFLTLSIKSSKVDVTVLNSQAEACRL